MDLNLAAFTHPVLLREVPTHACLRHPFQPVLVRA
jgi:hypothetical protein